jgi:orotate phosphoribosyltransferase
MNTATQIARLLLQIKAIKLNPHNPFTWASGILSPIYCDNRILLSYPVERLIAVNALVELAKSMGDFDLIAGVATAGIPHGILIADRLNLPFIYVRSTPKDHGTKSAIEGFYQIGQKTLVVEDLISTGKSSLAALEILRANGLAADHVISIFAYNLKDAAYSFEQQRVILKSLSDFDHLIHEAAQSGAIEINDIEFLKKWKNDPKGWKN